MGPGDVKTTAVAHFSHWVAETTGKCTLLFSSDGGGWEPCEEEVLAGMIRPFTCDVRLHPVADDPQDIEGSWPENPEETDISGQLHPH